MIRPIFAMLVALFAASCGTNHFVAPVDREVYMLTQDDPVTVRIVSHVWYAGWGTWALGENTSRTAIERNNLKEARYCTEQGVADTLLSTITGIASFSRRTLIVEGNPFLSSGQIPEEDQVPKTMREILEEKVN